MDNLHTWLNNRPCWERNLWQKSFAKETIDDSDIDEVFDDILTEHELELPKSTRPDVTFDAFTNEEFGPEANKVKLQEIKEIKNVNAIAENQNLKFSKGLTLFYGVNGSGKSGFARLLSNACSSKGERKILPNLHLVTNPSDSTASAKFIIINDDDSPSEIDYIEGEYYEELKRFSVFDSKSVLIHLDQSNEVAYTPSFLAVFDKITPALLKLEKKLVPEMQRRTRGNPTQNVLSGNSTISTFFQGLTADVDDKLVNEHTNFTQEDAAKSAEITKQIDAKKKLDIPAQKKRLIQEQGDLQALKQNLTAITDKYTDEAVKRLNDFIVDINTKKDLVKALSAENFNNPVFSILGNEDWKSLIRTAKILYSQEQENGNDIALDTCILCHTDLNDRSKELFKNYWNFLESKAEAELLILEGNLKKTIEKLHNVIINFPALADTDTGVRILSEELPEYREKLKADFAKILTQLKIWKENLQSYTKVSANNFPKINLQQLETLINNKIAAEKNLHDPTDEIKKLEIAKNILLDKEKAAKIKSEIISYIDDLRWLKKANKIQFPKKIVTQKRTDLFNQIVTDEYRQKFIAECKELNCDFGLNIQTRGTGGNTVKDIKLSFTNTGLSQVLSEGEQKVCALADFLTDVSLDLNNCGIIFDDPVTSLDHERKDLIAKRLVKEAFSRQVIIFTHDIVFVSQIAKYAHENSVEWQKNWIKTFNGISGIVEHGASPRLANTASLMTKAKEALKNFESLSSSEQELTLASSFNDLRSACEASIEEKLFAGIVSRYNDAIKVQSLEIMPFDKDIALRIVNLHGKLSEIGTMHNRSDLMRENPTTINDFDNCFKELEGILKDINASKSIKEKERKSKEEEKKKKMGW